MVTAVIFFVLSWWIINEFDKNRYWEQSQNQGVMLGTYKIKGKESNQFKPFREMQLLIWQS